MSWKTIGLVLLFLDFTAFTAYAIATSGYSGFLTWATGSAWGLQVTLDLGIALTFVLVWMVRDARARGLTVLPYVLVTFVLGSIGPLAYLVRRELGGVRARRQAVAPA